MPTPRIDLAASHRHYLDHLLPVWRALPAEARGDAWLEAPFRDSIPGALPLSTMPPSGPPTLIAGFDDLRRIGSRPIILMEHGCGQSYADDPMGARHPAYAGGTGRHGVIAFLCPNEYAADRNRKADPQAHVEVVGSPRVAELRLLPAPPPPGERPVVAFSFHWPNTLCAEAGTGWPHWWQAVKDLHDDGQYEVLGHAHPRAFHALAPVYTKWGIEPVEHFRDVLTRAHVFACDNSSALFEFAEVRGPVVVLDWPAARTNVHHGLRFWDAADVGPRILNPGGLPMAIKSALAKQPYPGAAERLERIFPPVADPAAVAAAAALAAAAASDGPTGRTGGLWPRR